MNPKDRACSREFGPQCRYLIKQHTWWCANEFCRGRRGTGIPGVVDCPFYAPKEFCEHQEPNPCGLGRVAAITGSLFTLFVLIILIGIMS